MKNKNKVVPQNILNKYQGVNNHFGGTSISPRVNEI